MADKIFTYDHKTCRGIGELKQITNLQCDEEVSNLKTLKYLNFMNEYYFFVCT